MKQIRPKVKVVTSQLNVRVHFGWKPKVLGALLVFLLLLGLGKAGVDSLADWSNVHTVEKNKILSILIELNWPYTIKDKQPTTAEIINVINEQPMPENLTPIQDYICKKFGALDCKVALAINASEGNFQDEVFHINTNGTIDFGCWQINQIHITSGSITAKDALDCYKATDWAYNKFVEDGGWGAWSAFNNGAFTSKLQ